MFLAQKLDFAAAGPLMDRALATSRKLLGDNHPQTRQMANEIRAFEMFRNIRVGEQTEEEPEAEPDVPPSFDWRDCGRRAELSLGEDESVDALSWYRTGAELAEEAGDPQGQMHCLAKGGKINAMLGQLDDAVDDLSRAAALARTSRNDEVRQFALGFLGIVLDEQGKHEDAMTAYAEEELMCRRLGRHDDVAICLFKQAETLLDGINDPTAAQAQLEEGIRVLAATRARPELLAFSERLRQRIAERL